MQNNTMQSAFHCFLHEFGEFICKKSGRAQIFVKTSDGSKGPK